MAKTTNGSFTGAAQNSAVVLGKEADIVLSGTFVGTITPEVQDVNGNWVPVSGQSYTAPGAHRLQTALARPWRLSVASYTSGTIAYELGGEEFPQRF